MRYPLAPTHSQQEAVRAPVKSVEAAALVTALLEVQVRAGQEAAEEEPLKESVCGNRTPSTRKERALCPDVSSRLPCRCNIIGRRCHSRSGCMQHKTEYTASVRIVFNPNTSLVGFNNGLTDRETE